MFDCFDAISDLVFAADRQTHNVLYANPALCRAVGLSREEIQAQSLTRLFAGDVIYDTTVRSAALRVAGGSLLRVEVRFDTTTFNGDMCLIGVARPFPRSGRLDALAQVLPNLILHVSATGRLIDCVTNDDDLLLQSAEFLGCNITDLFDDDLAARLMVLLTETLAEQSPRRLEWSLSIAGELRYFEFRFAASHPHEAVIVAHEVTHQKHIEDEMQASEGRFRGLFEYSPWGIQLIDETGRVVEWNPASERILGLRRDEVIGEYFWDVQFQILPPEDQTPERYEFFYDSLQNFILTGEAPWINNTLEYAIQRRDGERRTILASGGPIKRAQGNHSCGMVHDITEQKQIERLLKCVAHATAILLTPGDLAKAINQALALLGPVAQVDRIAIFEILTESETGQRIRRMQYEWVVDESYSELRNPFWQNYKWSSAEIEQELLVYQSSSTAFGGPVQDFPPAIREVLKLAGSRSILIVPIKVNGQRWGLLSLDDMTNERIWSDEITAVLELMGASLGAALERQQHEAMLAESKAMSDTLREVGDILTAERDLDEVLDQLLIQVYSIVPYTAAHVMLLEGDMARIVRARGFSQYDIPDERYVGHVKPLDEMPDIQEMIKLREPVTRYDVSDEISQQDLDNFQWIRSWLSAPIIVQGDVIGLFSLFSDKPGVYTQHHCELIEVFTHQSAIALENANLYTQLRAQRDELTEGVHLLRALHAASREIISSLDPEHVVQVSTEKLNEIAAASSAILCDYDPADQSAVVRAVSFSQGVSCNPDDPCVQPGYRFDLRPPLFGPLLAQHDSIVLDGESLQMVFVDSTCLPHIQSAAFVPLPNGGQITGIAIIRNCQPDYAFSEVRLLICEFLANFVAVALEQAELFSNTQSLERIKTEMIRIASHDLRNPLTRITNSFRILPGNGQFTPDQSKVIGQAAQAAQRILDIAENLLSVERIEARYEHSQPVDWYEIIARVIDYARADLEAKKHQIDVRYASDIPITSGDPAQLHHAIYNLVDNAIKYTPPGGRIIIRAYLKDVAGERNVMVEVKDNGIGIPQEKQADLFSPFFRAPLVEGSDVPGIGLGLAVVKSVVTQHNGRVFVDGAPGEGSCFGFRVPVTPPAAHPTYQTHDADEESQ